MMKTSTNSTPRSQKWVDWAQTYHCRGIRVSTPTTTVGATYGIVFEIRSVRVLTILAVGALLVGTLPWAQAGRGVQDGRPGRGVDRNADPKWARHVGCLSAFGPVIWKQGLLKRAEIMGAMARNQLTAC